MGAKWGEFILSVSGPPIEETFEYEIRPILEALRDAHLEVGVRQSLGNYLVIRLVTRIENFFSNVARRTRRAAKRAQLLNHKSTLILQLSTVTLVLLSYYYHP